MSKTEDLPEDGQDFLEPTTAEKLRKLPWGISLDAANSIFFQLALQGSIFVLFLSELGFNKTQIGFLLSLIPLLIVVSLFGKPILDRWGAKRAFLFFWVIRISITAGVIFTPWIKNQYGEYSALVFVAAITTAHAVARAIGLIGWVPWKQEYVPQKISGKYFAYSYIAISFASMAAVSFSGVILNRVPGLNWYIFLFGVGIFFGMLGILAATQIPGGARRRIKPEPRRFIKEIFQPLADSRFFRFLGGATLITLTTTALNSFLPLFIGEKIGFSSGDIVFLTNGALAGAIITSYFWGWATDRYGSLPVMISGMLLKAIFAALLISLPYLLPVSLPVVLAFYFFDGFATMGWAIGSSRLLYVHIYPQDHADLSTGPCSRIQRHLFFLDGYRRGHQRTCNRSPVRPVFKLPGQPNGLADRRVYHPFRRRYDLTFVCCAALPKVTNQG